MKIKGWKEILNEVKRIRNRLYPDFVFAVNPLPLTDEIPVFIFHEVKYNDFEEKLRFLGINNYHTITTDELYEFITKNTPLRSNSVLLTFDDGRESLHAVAYPLLRKYGFKATAFIIPGCINNKKQEYPMVTWKQVEDMHQSGIIDFQSHTLYHNLDLNNSSSENVNAILDSFVKSKQLIEEFLRGKKVRHLCFPWGKGSRQAVELSKKAGYDSNLWVTVKGKRTNKFGDDPYYITRLKDDYIFRLPGKNRKAFIQILIEKLMKRLRNELSY